MRLLQRAIQQEQRSKRWLGAFLIVTGCIFGMVLLEKKNVLAVFGLLVMALGLGLLWSSATRRKVEDERLWQLLHDQRQEIVWIYSSSTQVMPFGLYLWERGTMFFMLRDGGEISIELPARQLKMVSRFLNKLLPHASFGYTAERQQQFNKNPALLSKQTE